jgi:hypothetical protein
MGGLGELKVADSRGGLNSIMVDLLIFCLGSTSSRCQNYIFTVRLVCNTVSIKTRGDRQYFNTVRCVPGGTVIGAAKAPDVGLRG